MKKDNNKNREMEIKWNKEESEGELNEIEKERREMKWKGDKIEREKRRNKMEKE